MVRLRFRHRNKFLFLCVVLAIGALLYQLALYKGGLMQVYEVEDQYALTSPGADLEVVDFNAYDCVYCQNLHPVLKEAMAQDGRIRYIPRMVSAGSVWREQLVYATYAAAEQGGFIALHDAIYQNWPVNTEEQLFGIAATLGLDVAQLSRDMTRPDIMARAKQDDSYFYRWGLKGTPALLIGRKGILKPNKDEMTVEMLLSRFEEVRAAR